MLIERYWAGVHPLYPFLDRQDFESCYQSIWLPQRHRNGRQSYSARHHEMSAASNAVDGLAGGGPDAKIFHCLLNLVFALACLSEDSGNCAGPQNAVVFWRRCKHLLQLDLDIFNKGSLQLVQVMLLTGLYLRAAEMTGGCWNITGNALRLAQGLGLHLPSSASSIHRGGNPLPYEMDNAATRWRVWMGCLLMDRSVLTSFSRRPYLRIGNMTNE